MEFHQVETEGKSPDDGKQGARLPSGQCCLETKWSQGGAGSGTTLNITTLKIRLFYWVITSTAV